MPITKDGKAVAPVYNQPAEYQRGDLANWIGAVNEDLDVLPVGYRSISQLITKSALMVQGEDGQLTEFTNRDAANVAMNNQLSPVVQASLEGRLYVKLDDKLLQLHTEEVKGRYDTNFSLSEPMDAPLALEVPKVEEPAVEEPAVEAPIKEEPIN